MTSTFHARDAAAYEQVMGRWSRRLAPIFAAFARIADAPRVLDVGCGPGSLLAELADNPKHRALAGIDASDIYLAAARTTLPDPRVELHHGDANALPFPDGSFDAALCQLVLQFIPRPGEAVAEMRRVVREGGTVAAATWCSSGGMPHQRMFWDTAALLDPAADAERGRTFSRPMTRPDELYRLFEGLGLRDVAERSATIWMDFADFADFWNPIRAGEGTLGRYAAGLDHAAAARLENHLRAAYCAGAPDGERNFACTAFLCRGTA